MRIRSEPFESLRNLDSRGVAAIEYALIASLIALSLLAAFMSLGGEVSNQFNAVDTGVSSGQKYGL